VRALVVALPQSPQAHLPANVPDFEVHVRQGDGCHVLADGGHGVAGCGRGFGIAVGVQREEGFDLGEEGGFASVVEAEEEDGVFCRGRLSMYMLHGEEMHEVVPSLLVA
jgi:hypothetical protein